jgi:hypothetical protein
LFSRFNYINPVGGREPGVELSVLTCRHLPLFTLPHVPLYTVPCRGTVFQVIYKIDVSCKNLTNYRKLWVLYWLAFDKIIPCACFLNLKNMNICPLMSNFSLPDLANGIFNLCLKPETAHLPGTVSFLWSSYLSAPCILTPLLDPLFFPFVWLHPQFFKAPFNMCVLQSTHCRLGLSLFAYSD